MKGSRKSFKIFIVSKGVDGIRPQLYLFFKVREDIFLYSSPIQFRSLSQKLVLKSLILLNYDNYGN